jgi:hypothetical protein
MRLIEVGLIGGSDPLDLYFLHDRRFDLRRNPWLRFNVQVLALRRTGFQHAVPEWLLEQRLREGQTTDQ